MAWLTAIEPMLFADLSSWSLLADGLLMASLASITSSALTILSVAIGLGLVIFFHELGHFAVAKWCDVHVERFSIGFGPIVWSQKWGETEYALSAVPFGGYVKMLGQDDVDPSQLSSEEIAEDPRSYSAKPVWQRMAIISAGVIMNVITAVLFFASAFGIGVTWSAPIIGSVQAGAPAWTSGIRIGDTIESINGRDTDAFTDLIRGVALSSGPIRMTGKHDDGTSFDVEVVPDRSGTRRFIGLGPVAGLTVGSFSEESQDTALAGTPAAMTEKPFKRGDHLVALNDTEIHDFSEYRQYMAKHRKEPVTYKVERKSESQPVEITVEPRPARSLGLQVESEQFVGVVDGSPADAADLQKGDKFISVDGQDVGSEIDPLILPQYFADRSGEEVSVVIQRQVRGADPQELEVTLIPEDLPAWLDIPSYVPGEPLAIPAIGVAYHLIPTVLSVDEAGPAAAAGIQPNDYLEEMILTLPEGAKSDGRPESQIRIKLIEDGSDGKKIKNWAYAISALQQFPTRDVEFQLNRAGEQMTVAITPTIDEENGWYLPLRGLLWVPLTQEVQAKSVPEALSLGLTHTRNSIVDIYLTLRNLITQNLSPKELRGPLGIATIAYQVAQQGVAELLLFLGFLSVNLAVLNFLPIPVLDGGHMVFLIWEGVTGKKPSEKVLATATYIGFLFILTLMVTVIYLDVFVHGFSGD
ncbi:site-2 protease family protein [Calycomorphotria hydatis]|uniref:Zinc metalloprotease n=1 Tax=Calycomorphotria hydatis TaxID=2528027 RepID=A0A517TB54_9PLAN|nr:site-2 protease family protein [Calycomorphotria hydatis]QDT65600.1 Putative zinc metalloprotease [Calycomorphotria hydatis]